MLFIDMVDNYHETFMKLKSAIQSVIRSTLELSSAAKGIECLIKK
jgi:hypothetical protein